MWNALNLRKQMLLGFGAVTILVGVLAVVSLLATSDLNAANGEVAEQLEETRESVQLQYRGADFNGWQTAYAFDIERGIDGATSDSAPSRAAFLEAAAHFEEEIETLRSRNITPQEMALVDDMAAAFDEFMAFDEQIIALYRSGDPDDADRASDIVTGQAFELFGSITAAAGQLADSIQDRSAASVADAAASGNTNRSIVLAVTAAAVALGIAIAWLLSRSVIRKVGGAANAVTGASDDLGATSAQMSAAAEETATQAGIVAAAGEQVSQNIQTVAAAVEQLSASVSEIADNATQASHVSSGAVEQAESANATVGRLGASSAEIGEVVDLISSIAEQTNLLALNATIEAARAGEAGKGFAVVAGEVKDLAKQTADATSEIGKRITAIQGDSNSAVAAIREIAAVIEEINSISTTIASAVEEQTSTTNEISRSVAEGARGSAEIAANITSVAEASRETAEASGNIRSLALQLTGTAEVLQGIVGSGDVGASTGRSRSAGPTDGLDRTPAAETEPGERVGAHADA